MGTRIYNVINQNTLVEDQEDVNPKFLNINLKNKSDFIPSIPNND